MIVILDIFPQKFLTLSLRQGLTSRYKGGVFMQIKDVCRRTGLTERAVRFYIEKELLSPEKPGGTAGNT